MTGRAFVCFIGLLGGLATCPPAFAENAHLKITGTPLELDVFFPAWDGTPYDSDWLIERKAAEWTGISLHQIEGDIDRDYVRTVERLIRSGKLPDIVGGSSLRDLFNLFGPQGAFLPLDDLIEDHAPHLRHFLDERPEMEKAIAAYDGHIYYIPYFPDGKYSTAYFIRQDWLDRLGLKMPQTVEEYHSVLKAFRTDDPNGNGLADEVPFYAPNLEGLLRLAPMWDARSSGSVQEFDFYVKGNRVVHGIAEPEYRTAMRALAQWYREGLINPNLHIPGGGGRDHFLRGNLSGATHDWFASTSLYNNFLPEEIPGFKLVPMLPPASASGQRKEEGRRPAIDGHGWAISYLNEHPVETIRYFDFWFSPEGRRLQNFGVEGVHYDLIDGRPVFRPEVLNSEVPVNRQLWAQGAQLPRGSHQDYAYEIQWTNEIAREGIRLYDSGDHLLDYYFRSALNEREQGVFDLYWPDLQTYMRDRAVAWITGEADVDAEWNAHLARLRELGLNEVTGVLNTARWRDLYGN